MKKRVAQWLSLCILLLFIVGCNQQSNTTVSEESSSQEESPVVEKEPVTITIRSIGDLLIHDSVYNNALQEDGTYYFDPMFEPVAKYIKNADLVTANLEVITAAQVTGASNYPFFSAPEELLDTLSRLGVDIVNNATNHTMDHGPVGAHASLKALQERGIEYAGSYESWDDYNRLRVLDVNGVDVGFLAYTYGLNGNYLPPEEEYLATLIDYDLIPLEIERLNDHCDFSIVMIHEGIDSEYPIDAQLEVHDLAIDAGANYILGGHPHILQPFKQYNDEQMSLFSHGNFLSGQYELENKLGGITEVEITKHPDDSVTIDHIRFMPTFNFGPPTYNYSLVIPLADGPEYGLTPTDTDAIYEQLKERMNAYSEIEFVDYLD